MGDASVPDEPDGLRKPHASLPNPSLDDTINIEKAIRTLNETGIRIINLDGGFFIGVWSDLDDPDIRKALQIAGLGDLGIRYPDGDDVPVKYKQRDVEGEPVPWRVLRAMEGAREKPWIVRDRMLAEIRRNVNSVELILPLCAGSLESSKLPRVTRFQKEFFPDLAKISAETLSELMEKSSRRGHSS
jgi:hypothetical protein